MALDVKRYQKEVIQAKKDNEAALASIQPISEAYTAATHEVKRLLEARRADLAVVAAFERDPNSDITVKAYNEAAANLRRYDALIRRAAAEEKHARVAWQAAQYETHEANRKRLARWRGEFQREVDELRAQIEAA